MDKSKAIELLERLIRRVKDSRRDGIPIGGWQLDSITALERVFGRDSRHVQMFRDISWSPPIKFVNADNSEAEAYYYRLGLEKSTVFLESALKEVQEFWDDDHPGTHADPFHRIERICNQFHCVARKLRDRHDGRATLDIDDEYDVQDLLHALLMIDFDDIRAEEWTPSYAGASSRMDFLLKREKIVVEAKRTRKGFGAKRLGEELIVDCQRYKAHQDCKMLVCFIYDPEGIVANPRGVEADLSTAGGELPVKVFIRP